MGVQRKKHEMTARNEFSVRVTTDVLESDQRFQTLWGRLGGVRRVLICKEIGEKTGKEHWHGYIETDKAMHDASVRHHVSKTFEVSGANLSVKDPNKGLSNSTQRCLQYICKGGDKQGDEPCMVVRLGFSEEQVKEYHALYHVEKGQKGLQPRAGAEKRPSLYDELRAYCEERDVSSSEQVIACALAWAKAVRRGVHFVSFANAVALLCHQMDEPGEFAFETKLRNYIFGNSTPSNG